MNEKLIRNSHPKDENECPLYLITSSFNPPLFLRYAKLPDHVEPAAFKFP
jgi:hypothetical protein